MRPKRITVLVVCLAVMAALQMFGATYVLLMTLGVFDEPVAGTVIGQPHNQMEAVIRSTHAVTLIAAAFGVLANLIFWACIAGFWRMQKWAVALFAALTIVNLFIALVWQPAWALVDPNRPWMAFILPAIIFAVVLPSWRNMTPTKRLDETRATGGL